ncbi:uncharacterized protein LOC124161556 [Ischnura elegans]|uniref:uncharacterized protein LOC124161556 n=1 Tax=Ischnura elegans TaxID=197161 RepID=UPI001ED8BA21|nr:uncharacterized protein LOC124161556 [Ischnura elegans]
MQTSTILLVLAGTFLVACNGLPTVRDVSPVLDNMVKSIGSGLDTYLQAGFTKQARRLKNTPVSLQLGDLFFHMDDNTGMLLKNIRLPTLPALTAQSITSDLEYLNTKLQLSAESAVFEADYEITNNKFVSVLPLTSTGVLTATIKDIKISGVAGLAIADNIYQATNMDLKYTPAHVTIEVSYYEGDEKISSQVTVDSIEQSLLGKIKKEVEYRMNDIVRAQLNVLLNQQFLDQLFLGNDQMLAHYKDHAARFTLNANSIIDQLLSQADKALKTLGIDPIGFPDIYESFSKKILIVRWHGSFTANKGGINGLASLRRYKDVSLSVDNDVVTIFGGIGFQELSIGYSYYRAEFMGFGPTGEFRVGVQDPSIFLKLSVKLGFLTASVEDFKFEHAGQLKVDITGLDTFKWIIEQIANWVAGAFHDLMNSGLEQKMKDIINNIAKDLDLKPFFPPRSY